MEIDEKKLREIALAATQGPRACRPAADDLEEGEIYEDVIATDDGKGNRNLTIASVYTDEDATFIENVTPQLVIELLDRLAATRDLHKVDAGRMFNVEPWEVTPDQRKTAKEATFAERLGPPHGVGVLSLLVAQRVARMMCSTCAGQKLREDDKR